MAGLATGPRRFDPRFLLDTNPGRAALGRRRPPLGLLGLGMLAALGAALPAIYLVWVVVGEPAVAWETITDSRTVGLTLRTAGLTAAVTLTAVAIGVPLAWLTTRTDLPARRLWATVTSLPLVIPSYIGAYLIVSAIGPTGLARDVLGIDRLPSIYGFLGAWLALSLFTYPLVLLSVRASTRKYRNVLALAHELRILLNQEGIGILHNGVYQRVREWTDDTLLLQSLGIRENPPYDCTRTRSFPIALPGNEKERNGNGGSAGNASPL